MEMLANTYPEVRYTPCDYKVFRVRDVDFV